MDNSLPPTKNVQIIHANINGLYKRRILNQTENFRHITNSYPLSILIGDFNCKHTFFGCKVGNSNGDILFNIIE